MKFEEVAVWGFISLGVAVFLAFPEKNDGVFWSCVGIFAGILVFVYGFVLSRRKNIIEQTPTSKVCSMAMGQVEIKGKALADKKVMKSPFGQIDSVYYKLTIDEQRGKHSYNILNYETPSLFRVEDDTGVVLVNPKEAEFHLEDKTYSISMLGGEASEACEKGLTHLEIPLKNRLGMKRAITAHETVIHVDQQVHVMGNATRINQSDTEGENDPMVVIEKGNDQVFLIANERELDLLGALSWMMNVCLFGGPLVGAGSFLWLMSYL